MTDSSITGAAFGDDLTFPALYRWAGAMFKSPPAFFAGLARTGGYATPMLYALFWLFASALIELGVARVRPSPVQFGTGVEIAWLVFGPFILLMLGCVAAAVFFVIWNILGSKESYETAFRCWAFTTPVSVLGALLGIVPFLNALAFLYGTYLLIMASIHTHKVSRAKSWGVWGTLCVLLLGATGAAFLARRKLQGLGLMNPQGMPAGMPNFATGAVPPDMQQMAEQLQKQLEQQQAAPPGTTGKE